MIWLLAVARAGVEERCVRGSDRACDRWAFESAVAWARGELGWGPQEPWRADIALRVADITSERRRWACGQGDPEACRELGGDGLAAIARGDRTDANRAELPAPPVCFTPFRVRNPSTSPTWVVLTASAHVDGWPEPANGMPAVDRPESWKYAVLDAVGFAAEVEPGASLDVPCPSPHVAWSLRGQVEGDVPGGVRDGRERPADCGVRVEDGTGRPVEGAVVYGPEGLDLTDGEGVARVCRAQLAVKGEAAGVPDAGGWRIALVDGARAQCRVAEASVPCDAVATHLVHGAGTWGGASPTWKVDPALPGLLLPWRGGTSGWPPRGYTAAGPACLDGEHWVPCPSAERVTVVDEGGRPAPTLLTTGPTDLMGRGFGGALAAPEAAVPFRRDASTIVLRSRPRSGSPAPEARWRTWRRGDWRERLARVTPGLEPVPFTGGGVLRDERGALMVLVAFATPTDAVVLSPLGRRFVSLDAEGTP